MLKKNSYWFIFMFMSAYILLFCLLGIYNWPMPGDDFGFAASVAQNGFWKAQYLMYMTWAGRIFNTFLVDLCVMLPLEKFYPFLAIINIITYIAAMYIFIKAIKPDIFSRSAMLLTVIFTASTLSFTYSLHETFYWLAGSPYFWCTSLILLEISFAVKALGGYIFYCALP